MQPDTLLRHFPGRQDAHGFAVGDGKFVTKRQALKPIHAKAHLAGEVRIGRHPVLPNGTCPWALIDVDEGGVTPLLDLRDVLRRYRVAFAVERSKSKGYHVWLWFASPVPAWKARAVLRALVEEAGWPDVEVFPKQDGVDADGLGNFVWLPLHGGSVKEGRTLFLNIDADNWPPFEDQAAFLATVPKMSEVALDRILTAKGIQAPAERKAPAMNNGNGKTFAGGTTLPLPPCAATVYAEGISSPGRSDWAHFLSRHFRRRGLPEEATVRLLLDWNQKNKPEPLPPDKIAAMVHTAYVKEYTSLGCEYLKGAKELCKDECPMKAKQTREAASTEEAPQGECVREGDDFRYTWSTVGVEIRVSRLRDANDGPQGELSISVNGRGLHWGRAYLASVSARETIVKKLMSTQNTIPWREMLEQVCQQTTEALRATSPTVQLVPRVATGEQFVFDKLVLKNETSLLFADGGKGKSLTALAIAVAVALNKPLPCGLSPRISGPVLFLDWESCREVHEEQLHGLLAGLGLSAPVDIHYRKMSAALVDDLPAICEDVACLNAVLVIVDSYIPASGTDPEGTNAATCLYNALHALPTSRFVLSHLSKTQADMRGAARPFGSVMNMNLPRSVWELRRADEDPEDVLTVAGYHRKTNRILLAPFGIRFAFDNAAHIIRLSSPDLAEDEGLRERAGLRYGVLAFLRGDVRPPRR